jgi:hypothetical protein
MASRVNWNVDRLSQNPNSNEEDTIGAHWHGDVDLEAIPRWHAYAYLYTILGCSRDVPQISVNDWDPHDVDIKPKGNGALNISWWCICHYIFASKWKH